MTINQKAREIKDYLKTTTRKYIGFYLKTVFLEQTLVFLNDQSNKIPVKKLKFLELIYSLTNDIHCCVPRDVEAHETHALLDTGEVRNAITLSDIRIVTSAQRKAVQQELTAPDFQIQVANGKVNNIVYCG